MTIGEKIQFLRTQKHISQEELAGSIGVSRQAISKWETDQSIPDLENLKWLAEYFQVKLSSLIEEGELIQNEVIDTSKSNTLLRVSRFLLLTSIILSCCFVLLMILLILFQDIFFWKNGDGSPFIFPIPTFLFNTLLCVFLVGSCFYLWKETKKTSKGIIIEIIFLILAIIIPILVRYLLSTIERIVIDGYFSSEEMYMGNLYLKLTNLINTTNVIYSLGVMCFMIGTAILLSAKYMSKKGYLIHHTEKPYNAGYGFLSFILGFMSLISIPLMAYWLYEIKQLNLEKYKRMRVPFIIGVCIQAILWCICIILLISIKMNIN